MVKWLSKGFWATVARIILRNRIIILTIIAAITVVMEAMEIHALHVY